MLEKVDSKYAKKISVNDKTRILRALEVFYETGKNISFYHSKKKYSKNYNFYKIFLSPSKEQVAKNATIRLKKMIERGLLEEFNKNKKNVRNCNISKAIGFQELNDYCEKKKLCLIYRMIYYLVQQNMQRGNLPGLIIDTNHK